MPFMFVGVDQADSSSIPGNVWQPIDLCEAFYLYVSYFLYSDIYYTRTAAAGVARPCEAFLEVPPGDLTGGERRSHRGSPTISMFRLSIPPSSLHPLF